MQYGFFIDQSRCIGCNSCTVACMQWHGIQPGFVKWMRVHQWEKGLFPDIRLHMLPVMCYHCENPLCIKACPNIAIYKEERFGAVLIKPDRCQGARKCWKACPYGAPQYEGDDLGKKMSKCNMCIDRLGAGLKPICVLSCSMRALEFGPFDEIMSKYGNLRRLEDMPSDSITHPAVVFKPADRKNEVIAWNYERALELWSKRESASGGPLPNVFESITDVTQAPQEIVGRNRLVLKARNAKELNYYTTDDE
jgi:anaerobic dimethyl sulfoxide reductase subunit B (iron-sulfur subunit)